MTDPNNSSLAARIARVSRLHGEFLLRSGVVVSEYFDKYRFESDPLLLAEIADSLARLIPERVDALAGLELGGVPLSTALSLRTGLPAVFVRKQAKEYGTARLAEGGEISGRCLLVIEDVVTSGGQLLESSKALRQLGATVNHALCVIDRLAGGKQALAAEGVHLISLFTKDDLDEAERSSTTEKDC